MESLYSFTFTREGQAFKATVYADGDGDAPWDREDGHGPVSGWVYGQPKKPGELVLNTDRGSKRYYDFAEAMRIAKRDGWGCPNLPEGLTPGQVAERAVRADFERLRAWCRDDWQYVGVSVTPEGLDDDFSYALWGVESDSEDYIKEVANALAGEALQAEAARSYPVTNWGI